MERIADLLPADDDYVIISVGLARIVVGNMQENKMILSSDISYIEIDKDGHSAAQF